MKNITDLNPVGRGRRKLDIYFITFFLGLSLVTACLFFGLKIKDLNTNYSMKDFFPAKHSLLELDNHVKKAFSLKENSTLYFILSRTDQSSWLGSEGYQQVTQMSEIFRNRSDVKSVLSISSIEGAAIGRDGLNVGPILENKTPTERTQLVSQNPIIKPMLLSRNDQATVIAVEPISHDPGKVKQLVNQIRWQLYKSFPKINVEVAGIPAIQYRLAEVIQSDLARFFVFVMIVFCAMFYFLFRQLSIVFFGLGALLLVNTVIIGMIAHFKVPFSAILTTLPILVSISAMSILVHTLELWSHVEKETDFRRRFFQSFAKIKELFLPNFMGSLTTAIGFAALASSSIPIIKKYGLIVAASVAGVWLLTQIYLLVGMVWLNPKQRAADQEKASWSLWGMKYAGIAILGTLTITIVMSSFIPKLQFSSKLFDDLPTTDSIRTATEKIDRDFGGIVSYDLVLSARTENFWRQNTAFKSLKVFAEEVNKINGVGSTITHFDFLPTSMMTNQAAMAEAFFLFSLAADNPLKQFVTEDGRHSRVLIRLHDRETKYVESIRSQIVALAKKRFGPAVRVQESGLALNSHTINQDVAKHLVFGFWESLVLIGLFLIFLFRSLKWALIACIPNLIPPVLLMGFMGAMETNVKPGVALIFSIVLGLAFNNTVYFLSRLKSLMGDQTSFQKCLKKSLLQEGNPCASETLVMLAGFSIFIFSSFTMNKMFGGFMILSIVFGFVADLFFLPALLSYFPEIGKRPVAKEKYKRSFNFNPVLPAASVVLLAIVFIGIKSNAMTAKQILAMSAKSLSSADDQADVQMDIVEANQEVKVRKFKMKTMNKDGFHALIRMQEPRDIKNTGFLAQIRNGEEQQWIYLPSSKQVRRITSKKSENGILGSEISSEDLNMGMAQSSKVALSGQNDKYHILNISFPKGQGKYTHAFSYLDKRTFVPMMTVYYNGAKKIKTVDFKGYKLINNKTWRAQEIKVVNHTNNRRTNLKFKSYRVNAGTKANEFSQSALKDES